MASPTLHGSKTFPDRIFNVSRTSGLTHSQYGRIYSSFNDNSELVWVDNENMIPFHHWTCNVNYLEIYNLTKVRKIDDSGSFPIVLMCSGNTDSITGYTGKICYQSIRLGFSNKSYLFSDENLMFENYPLNPHIGLSFDSFTISLWLKMWTGLTFESDVERSIIRNTCGEAGITNGYVFDFVVNYGNSPPYFKMYYGKDSCYASFKLPKEYTTSYLIGGQNWMHLAIGLDCKVSGDTLIGDYYFYIDGKYTGRYSYSDTYAPNCQFINQIGRQYSRWYIDSGTTNDYIDAQYEDIRFYTRSLTPHEIGYIYNQGQGTFNQSYCNGFPTIKYPKYWFKTQERFFDTDSIMNKADCINVGGTFSNTLLDSADILAGIVGHIDRFPDYIPNYGIQESFAFSIDSTGDYSKSQGLVGNSYFNINDTSGNTKSNYSFTFWILTDGIRETFEVMIVGNNTSIKSSTQGDICIYMDQNNKMYFQYGDGGVSNTVDITGNYTSGNWGFFAVSVKYNTTSQGSGDYLTSMYNDEFGNFFSTPRNLFLKNATTPNQGLYAIYVSSNNTSTMTVQDLRIFNYSIEYDEMINIYNEGNGILF